jgi:LysR family transcriptional regulator, cys regulon transcriptional activator
LHAIDAGHLFEVNMTRLAFRRGSFLRSYAYAFIETFAAPLTREVVEAAAQQASQSGAPDEA